MPWLCVPMSSSSQRIATRNGRRYGMSAELHRCPCPPLPAVPSGMLRLPWPMLLALSFSRTGNEAYRREMRHRHVQYHIVGQGQEAAR